MGSHPGWASPATTPQSLSRAKSLCCRTDSLSPQGWPWPFALPFRPAAASDRSPGQVQRPGLQTLEALQGWLNAATNRQSLVFFHIYEPHKPYAPPAEFQVGADAYDGEVALSDAIVAEGARLV